MNAEVNVLFVCLGNICRSPSAEGVFRQVVQRSGFEGRIAIDSPVVPATGMWAGPRTDAPWRLRASAE